MYPHHAKQARWVAALIHAKIQGHVRGLVYDDVVDMPRQTSDRCGLYALAVALDIASSPTGTFSPSTMRPESQLIQDYVPRMIKLFKELIEAPPVPKPPTMKKTTPTATLIAPTTIRIASPMRAEREKEMMKMKKSAPPPTMKQNRAATILSLIQGEHQRFIHALDDILDAMQRGEGMDEHDVGWRFLCVAFARTFEHDALGAPEPAQDEALELILRGNNESPLLITSRHDESDSAIVLQTLKTMLRTRLAARIVALRLETDMNAPTVQRHLADLAALRTLWALDAARDDEEEEERFSAMATWMAWRADSSSSSSSCAACDRPPSRVFMGMETLPHHLFTCDEHGDDDGTAMCIDPRSQWSMEDDMATDEDDDSMDNT